MSWWADSRRVEAGKFSRLGRREFLSRVAVTAAGLFVAPELLQSCGGDTSTAPAAKPGGIRGTVVDVKGAPQAIGRVYLLQSSGLNQNRYADVDASGKFDFGDVAPDNYQVRYWGGTQAYVADPTPNPVRVNVVSGQTVNVPFTITLGVEFTNSHEVYAGDDFYQVQPFGDVGGTLVVKLGDGVCWYNVGTHDHTITGGPWKDSGVLHEADSFMWTANVVGIFPYQCSIHGVSMQATLQVTA